MVDLGKSALLEIPGVSPSVRFHVSLQSERELEVGTSRGEVKLFCCSMTDKDSVST